MKKSPIKLERKKRRKNFKKKEEKKRENVKNKSARFMIKLYSFKRSKKVERRWRRSKIKSGWHLVFI